MSCLSKEQPVCQSLHPFLCAEFFHSSRETLVSCSSWGPRQVRKQLATDILARWRSSKLSHAPVLRIPRLVSPDKYLSLFAKLTLLLTGNQNCYILGNYLWTFQQANKDRKNTAAISSKVFESFLFQIILGSSGQLLNASYSEYFLMRM